MKNKKLKRMTWLYALRGLLFGVVVSLVVFLLVADSDAYHNSERTLSDFVRAFPAFWVMLVLPLLCAAAGGALAWRMARIVRSMNQALKAEARRSGTVLQVVESLSAGKLDVKIGSGDKEDDLLSSLAKLQKNLKQNQMEDMKRREEEQQRTWVTNGVAQFGEVLRRNNDNMGELSYEIIRYLVDYVHLTQAGFFLLHDGKDKGDNGKRFFELSAFVAYDRRKYADKTIEWGEGLVGRCALEQKTIYMTELPAGYFTVTSGLGEGQPGALILVPLRANETVYGVIEMAALQPLLRHEIEFLEKTAESIAMTISTVRTNMQTSALLEETRQQAAKMREQEDSLRQNIEEMRATQEDSERREAEMKGFVAAIDHASISMEFATDGTILKVNDNFLRAFGYQADEVAGQNLSIFFFKDEQDKLDELLATLERGETFNGRVRRRSKRGEEVWLLSTYTPVRNNFLDIEKVISLEIDIADQVKLEREMQDNQRELDIRLRETRAEVEAKFKEIEAVKVRNEKTLDGMLDAIVTTDQDGVVSFFNVAAEKMWGYKREEVLGRNVSMLFAPDDIEKNDFIKAFVTPDMPKSVGERKEVPIRDKFGEAVQVLVLLSGAEVDGEHSFTAFIQQIEVELF